MFGVCSGSWVKGHPEQRGGAVGKEAVYQSVGWMPSSARTEHIQGAVRSQGEMEGMEVEKTLSGVVGNHGEKMQRRERGGRGHLEWPLCQMWWF